MKDIARDLGVSVVTVSKVLRNHQDIGAATRKRVLERMKELNYQPNFSARALLTGHTYLVGLVVPDLLHPFFAEVAKALSKALLIKGYYLIISSSEEDTELETREIDQLLNRRLDALIVASSRTTPEIFERMEKQGGPPYVLIDRQLPGLAANFVGVDDEIAGALATEHLVSIGCKRIAHLRGPDISPGAGRLKGYTETLAKHGLKVPAGYVSASRASDVHSRESGITAMRELLSVRPRPDGVFCFNDPAAIGAMEAILDAGLRIPRDIAVIGCGNLHYNDTLRVPLSSIDQNTQQIGDRAARLTLSLLASKGPQRRRTILVEPSLVIRASTKKSS